MRQMSLACAAPLIRWLANVLPDKWMHDSRKARRRMITVVRGLLADRRAELAAEADVKDAGERKAHRRQAVQG